MKKLFCFWCDAELEQQGGGNIAIHFVCPNGCGAWWPETDMSDDEIVKLWESEQAYKRSISKKGGGSKTKGRKNDKRSGADMRGKYWLPE